MKYKNPANDHTEEILDSDRRWVLLIGPIYWASKGVWTHAVMHLVLSAIVFCTGFYIGITIGFGISSQTLLLYYSGLVAVFAMGLALIISFTFYFMLGCIYMRLMHSILEKHYGRMGWIKVQKDSN